MAISQITIKNQILEVIKNNNKEGEEGIKQFASDMARIMVDAIKSGVVTVAIGIPVQVTPLTGTGTTISTGTGVIN
jgi:TRAP-type uncharacterized transport system fused permease subunit